MSTRWLFSRREDSTPKNARPGGERKRARRESRRWGLAAAVVVVLAAAMLTAAAAYGAPVMTASFESVPTSHDGSRFSFDDALVISVDPDDSGVSQVLPKTESADARLSALSVDGESVAGFGANTTSYQFGVAHTVAQVTVAGVAAHADATLAYSGTDADDLTDGHQVDLSAGQNMVTVTVTAADGNTTKEYTVSVNRGTDAPFGWKPEEDFDTLRAAENHRTGGIWSDGTTMWVGDDGPNKLFAYTLATKQRNPAEEFNTLDDQGNRSIRGLWSDGTTMWVGDYNGHQAFAYERTTKAHDGDKDLPYTDPEPRWGTGIWSDGTTMWVADPVYDKLFAYQLTPWSRDDSKDIRVATWHRNHRASDLWSDGTTMWVADSGENKIFAYSLDNGKRDSARDFKVLAPTTRQAGGIWSDGTTMWVADRNWGRRQFGKIHAYNMPGNPDLSALSLSAGTLTPSFHRVTNSYAVSVEHSVSTITVTATAVDAANATVEFLDADDMPLTDDDGVTDDLQVNLVVGETTIKVKVTADDGVVTRTYTMTVTREPLSTDLSALSVGGESVAGFDAETTSYEFGVAGTVTQVTITGLAVDAAATITYSGTDADSVTEGHQVDLSVGRNVVTVTVSDSDGRQHQGLHRQRQSGVGCSLRLERRERPRLVESGREYYSQGCLVQRHDHVGGGQRGGQDLRLCTGHRAAGRQQGHREPGGGRQ